MFSRSERLKELFKAEVIRALREVKDPGISGFMTVTDLELSVDKKTATVYYSILGTAHQRESTAKALERASPFLRQILRKRLTIKRLPNFVFVFDDTPQRASRIDKMLLQLEAEKRAGEE